MTNLELLSKLEGYLLANKDRGLTSEQILECLEMIEGRVPEPPINVPSIPTYPPSPSIPPYIAFRDGTQDCGFINTCPPISQM